ncbi:MAG: hypothetical protein SGJ02_05985 [bacterium]|nr:hypothetical protein [bacterium]
MFEDVNDVEMNDLLRSTASAEPVVRSKALTQILTAVTTPVRSGIFDGDTTAGVFNIETLPPGVSAEYPTDFVSPGSEGEFRAFTNPGKGKPPALVVSGDKLTLASTKNILRVEYDLSYARNARWNIVARLTEAFMAGFIKKRNDDCWHTILFAMADRDVTIFDIAAGSGQFTRKLFSNLRVSMARNSGGNAMSIRRGRATDVWVSPEGMESILSWNLDQVPDTVRASLYSMASTDNLSVNILGTTVHQMYELGAGQEYQAYYVASGGVLTPAGSGHAAADLELGIVLDLTNKDSFVKAINQQFEMFEDPALHAYQKGGFYGWEEYSIGVLNSQRVAAITF